MICYLGLAVAIPDPEILLQACPELHTINEHQRCRINWSNHWYGTIQVALPED